MSYLIINKGTNEVYVRSTLEDVAKIVHNEEPIEICASDIHWSIKRCGRWDREDGFVIVIPSVQED